MVSISDLLEQHDNEKEQPKLTKKEKQKLKNLKKKLELEAKIRRAHEDEMAREINMANRNIDAFRTKWKAIQMEKGRPEYKDYMMEHWSLFDHAVDKKDDLIEALCDELEYTERIRRVSQVDNVLEIDRVLNDFYTIIEDIKESMNRAKEKLLKNRNIQVHHFTETSNQTDENLRLVSYLIDINKRRDDETWGGEFIAKLDEEVSKDLSDRELMVARMEVKLLALWKEYKGTLEGYRTYSQKIVRRSEPLMEKVKLDDQLIIDQKNKLTGMRAMIDLYRHKASKGSKTIMLNDLRNEKTDLYTEYMEQKKRLTSLQNRFDIKIRQQVNACLGATNSLNEVIKQGEEIFKYFELTQKLETKHEQFNPVHNELTYSRATHMQGDLPVRTKMVKFWKRVGRAEMVMGLMEVERRKLKRERNKLQKYMENLSKSPEMQRVLKNLTRYNSTQTCTDDKQSHIFSHKPRKILIKKRRLVTVSNKTKERNERLAKEYYEDV